MRLLQFVQPHGERALGLTEDSERVVPLKQVASLYALAQEAIRCNCGLAELAGLLRADQDISYQALVDERRLLSPIDHPDPAHLLVSGTGLTHLGSADTRHRMHSQLSDSAALTDSMKMFKLGLEGGKPARPEEGVAPEWFYKGDGGCIVPPERELHIPDFALDTGEEPEIAGIYLIDADGNPRRLGFALGNEVSDHITEQQNYLYLAHSKLRQCALGPELLLGELPSSLEGVSRIWRDGALLWEKPFLSGEDNMSHSLANLERHHFKYENFRRPGDVHVHFFGTATLSFADRVSTRQGDVFEIACAPFGRPLRNRLGIQPTRYPPILSL
jgi:hypothetical protein